jgi:chemotaxis family two-component system response regulator Rcp1
MRKVGVLVIEDNPADLSWLASVLEDIGLNCSCWSVSDGEEALDFLLKRDRYAGAPTPDLIFLDAHLPKLDGIEILRHVPDAQELPICVVTSSDRERRMFRSEFGIQDSNYLIKPVNTRDIRLCPRVRDYIQASR